MHVTATTNQKEQNRTTLGDPTYVSTKSKWTTKSSGSITGSARTSRSSQSVNCLGNVHSVAAWRRSWHWLRCDSSHSPLTMQQCSQRRRRRRRCSRYFRHRRRRTALAARNCFWWYFRCRRIRRRRWRKVDIVRNCLKWNVEVKTANNVMDRSVAVHRFVYTEYKRQSL